MGYSHPDELLMRMTSHQLSEWYAWARIRGMPEDRADLRSGQICAVLANIHRSDTTQVFNVTDFMPAPIEEPEEEEPDIEFDLEAVSRSIAALLGRTGA